MTITRTNLFAGMVFAGALVSAGGAPTLTIDMSKPVGPVSPRLYGLMTEEINYSYDGGLYAELVRNRAFLDDREKPAHWSIIQQGGAGASMALDFQQPLNEAIPVSLRLDVTNASPTARAGIANSGYWGIPVRPGTSYHLSFHAKAAADLLYPVTLSIVGEEGATVYAETTVPGLTTDWKTYNVTLKTGSKAAAIDKAQLVLSVGHPGTIWFGLVSLFPPTWKNQTNGFRKDLMQMLVDMKPKFLRFPGGNYVEGDTIATRFDWKKTTGPIEQRPGHQGPWGYRSSDGMGLAEFLRWCEDMGAEPVLAVYAGYSLKGEHVEPGHDLEPFVQDAVDEIEYVTGSKDTKWGAQRVADGHLEPFALHYVEIGNEDWFDKSGSYDGRFAQFFDAIKAKYPEIKCISTVGNEQPEAKRVHSRKPDALDEHYYRSADSFLKDGGHYDHYDRYGPEIFVGEWAAHETPFPPWDRRSRELPPTPNMKAALGDAVWMTGMERNCDIVKMNCYAPLLVNVNGRQWRPDLIGYDGLRAYGSPSYYAMQMFSRNLGDELLRAEMADGSGLGYAVTRDSHSGVVYIKIVNSGAEEQAVEIRLDGAKSVGASATAEILSADPAATNSIDEPAKVVPATVGVKGVKADFTYRVPATSVVVLKIKTK